jgi:hypothetical protein
VQGHRGCKGGPIPPWAVDKLNRLAHALIEPQAERIIDRALTEATVLKDQRFPTLFMEQIWPRSKSGDDGLMERLEDLERRVMGLEEQVKSEN